MERKSFEDITSFLSLLNIFSGAINKATLQHYVDFFDFSNLRLDLAFR